MDSEYHSKINGEKINDFACPVPKIFNFKDTHFSPKLPKLPKITKNIFKI